MSQPTAQPRPDPVAAADDAARLQARDLLRLRHAALAYTDAQTLTPGISRIGFGLDPANCPMTLISALAAHSAGLRANPACALLLGEPGERGDPLTHPRLMVQAEAEFIAPDHPDRTILRAAWLRDHPKATLYVDFADFAFVRLHPVSAVLNAGFGKAFRLLPADLVAP